MGFAILEVILDFLWMLAGWIISFLLGYIWREQSKRIGVWKSAIGMAISLIAWLLFYYFISYVITFIH